MDAAHELIRIRITPKVLDEFGAFAADPKEAARYIENQGRVLVGSAGSPRSLAYQLSNLDEYREQRTGLQRLIQSVFAVTYCDSEQAAGLFTDKLVEPPYEYLVDADAKEVSESIKRLEFGAMNAPGYGLRLQPGIGKVVTEIRTNLTMQPLRSGDDTIQADGLRETLGTLTEHFAKAYGRTIAAQPVLSATEVNLLAAPGGTLFAVCFVLQHLGYPAEAEVVKGFALGATPLVTFGVLWRRLSCAYRNVKMNGELRAAINRSLDYRYHRVPMMSADG